VDRQYDLFEIFPDGSPLWWESVVGRRMRSAGWRNYSRRIADPIVGFRRDSYLKTMFACSAYAGVRKFSLGNRPGDIV
jgi:hypothetical protein